MPLVRARASRKELVRGALDVYGVKLRDPPPLPAEDADAKLVTASLILHVMCPVPAPCDGRGGSSQAPATGPRRPRALRWASAEPQLGLRSEEDARSHCKPAEGSQGNSDVIADERQGT